MRFGRHGHGQRQQRLQARRQGGDIQQDVTLGTGALQRQHTTGQQGIPFLQGTAIKGQLADTVVIQLRQQGRQHWRRVGNGPVTARQTVSALPSRSITHEAPVIAISSVIAMSSCCAVMVIPRKTAPTDGPVITFQSSNTSRRAIFKPCSRAAQMVVASARYKGGCLARTG